MKCATIIIPASIFIAHCINKYSIIVSKAVASTDEATFFPAHSSYGTAFLVSLAYCQTVSSSFSIHGQLIKTYTF